MRNRFGFLGGLGSSRSQKIAMPGLAKSARENRCSPTNLGVTDLRFGRSLALRKAKSKGYNLIKGSELKEVTLSSYQVVLRFKYSREEDWRNLPRKSVFSNKSGVTDLRFGQVVLDLESGFEVRAGVASTMRNRFGFLDGLGSSRSQKIAMPEDWRIRRENRCSPTNAGVTDLRFGKDYNLIKGSELKEVVLDLESGFEVRAEVQSACRTGLGF
ncbi:hypothetical protein NE237_014167 [Protea cynaroides]|uniref:Uncharacterized protein n=1 Tax=Protea cynaroides TaxID=273540 RepID=A0A9Q0GKZ4_9MAGN|nr:hypothetical protein NE237_014167 [Protea cynaroides]